MRLLYVHYKEPSYRPGGMEVHITSSTDALRALGHEVEVLPMLGEGNGALSQPGSARPRGVLRRQAGRFVFQPRCFARLPRRWRALRAAIQEFRPDVLMVRYCPFEWAEFLVARRCGVPLVLEINATSFEIRQWKSAEIFLYPFTAQLEARVLRSADEILVVSRGLKQLLVQQGLLAQRIHVNPNGADPDRFTAVDRAPELRRRLGLDGAVVVGFLGSFARWHDLETIFSVIPDLVRHNANVRFLFAGGDLNDVRPDLRARLRGLEDRVVFTGPFEIKQAPEYLAAMDIGLTLFPHIEPFNASVVKQFEYMAAGKAVVATAIGQQAEIIEDGVSGLLVDPGDVAGVRAAVQRLLDDPALRQELGAAAVECVVANWTWKHNAQRIIEVCEHALRR